MGYEINYNPQDYAQAVAACRAVAVRAGDAGRLIRHCLLAAAASRLEAQVRAGVVGLSAWLPAGEELARTLHGLEQAAGQREATARELAAKLQVAMDNAGDAERKVHAMFALLRAPHALWDVLAGARDNGWRPPRDDTERLLHLLAVLLNHEAVPMNGPAHGRSPEEGSSVQEAMARLSQLLHAQNVAPRQPVIVERSRTLAPVQLRGTLDDYYRLQNLARQEDSRILVGRTRIAGRDQFVVIVPGTQAGSDRENPLDARGIIDALGNESGNYARAVAQALESSGADAGSDVILSGHSQGGMHAVNLAGHPLLRHRFTISSVLTLGSPIAPMKLPAGVKSLHVEDLTDPVPGMDGMKNSRSPNHVTVSFPGPSHPAQLDPGGFGRGHQLENYRDHLRELQRSPAGELRPVIGGLLLAPGPMQVRSYRLQRRVVPSSAKPEREEIYRKLGKISPRH